jgi:hypothetical protein
MGLIELKAQLTQIRGIRRRKGSLEETLSYALYKDETNLYSVFYRDKDQIKRASLKDFMESVEMSEIPLNRITGISRENLAVWTKGQKDLRVKKSIRS